MLQHSSVSEVAVTQVDVKDGVNVIAAFVVANSDLDEDTLKQWCEDRLAEYKCPRIYQFIEELPRTSTGKVIRRKLVNFL